jgi:hypothetical protein
MVTLSIAYGCWWSCVIIVVVVAVVLVVVVVVVVVTRPFCSLPYNTNKNCVRVW